MPLTPLDAENLRFPVVMRGYDRREVDEFRVRVAGALEEYINQLGALRARVGELEGALARYRENEELLKNSVVLAQRTADELAAAAHQRADAIVAAAHAEAGTIRQELAGLRAGREEFEYAFYGLLYGFLARLEQANPSLRQLQSPGGDPAQAVPALDVILAPSAPAMDVVSPPARPDAPGPRTALLSEMLPGRLPAAAPAAERPNPRDADSGNFSAALSRAGLASEQSLTETPAEPVPEQAPGGDETASGAAAPPAGDEHPA